MASIQKNISFALQIKTSFGAEIIKPFDTIDEAKDILQKTISLFDLGVSTWNSANIFHPINGIVAHLSYNGRLWEGEEAGFVSGQTKKEIFNISL